MIGSIDSQLDIEVYLDPGEINKINKEVIEGVLVKINKPKQQGRIFVSVNDERRNENGLGIGVLDKGHTYSNVGKFELFVSEEFYKKLKERGTIELGYGTSGNKVSLNNRNHLSWIELADVEHLEFYRDFRNSLGPELG